MSNGRFKSRPAVERFWAKVRVGPDCWEWLGYRMKNGYGTFWDGQRKTTAHRFSYELAKGPLPHGLEPDHLCRNRGCVNPQHMEAVSRSLNVQRGLAPLVNGGRQRAKTHCPKGHPYTTENTKVKVDRDGHSHRVCLACNREGDRRRYSPESRHDKYLRQRGVCQ